MSGIETAMNAELNPAWLAVFRTDENTVDWLYQEVIAGRLRQGWGAPGLALRAADGQRIHKTVWENAYRAVWGEDPSPKRYAILSYMLDLTDGDIVVIPKMPERHQFTIARVSEGYEFDHEGDRQDFNHIVHLDPESVRTFHYRANEDAYLISGLFSRANHRAAVSFCYSAEKVESALQLLQVENNPMPVPQAQLEQAAVDAALRQAAEALRARIDDWNGQRFEEAIRQAFQDQGYTLLNHRRYDGQGADADMLVSPPASRHSFFLPSEIAVQVKWKQGEDTNDVRSVKQIIQWAESLGGNAAKCVISSASRFTREAQELAAENNVVMICGMQTMCFLLGVADRYRDDWD